jgi:D-alanine transaminase
MSRIVYVNGEFLPEEDAKISVFDRSFLFADGVYEVASILEGGLIDNTAHLHRLERSLSELKMSIPWTLDEIEAAQKETVARNNVTEGLLYLQVSRGAADRDFAFPKDPKPILVMFTQEKKLRDNPAAERGISVISMEDLRWHRRDIKTVQLLYPSIAKQAALDAGADDAWLVEDDLVTEGTSNNAWIISEDGVLITRQLSHDILHGITRKAVMKLAELHQIRVEERPFTIEEARMAREAFITSASAFVMPVVKIDGFPLGDGTPGKLTRELRRIYLEMAHELGKSVS